MRGGCHNSRDANVVALVLREVQDAALLLPSMAYIMELLSFKSYFLWGEGDRSGMGGGC